MRLGIAVAIVVTTAMTFLLVRDAFGDCSHRCDVSLQDARGCCPAAPKAESSSKPKPVKPSDKTWPTIDVRVDADKNVVDAIVYLDGRMLGLPPRTIATSPGRHLLEIKREGFETYEQWITLADKQLVTVAPQLKPIAKTRSGLIIVDADVFDAEVYIDGNKHPDNTPVAIANVEEGFHVIEVRKAPSRPWRQTVQVTSTQTIKVRAELQSTMSIATGVVRVLSDTAGVQAAHAYIDGSDMGPVPVDITDVKPGEHIIQVRAPGMANGEKLVIVQAGSSEVVKLDLKPALAGDVGILRIVSLVAEAQVFIDDAPLGIVPVEKRLASGNHKVVVRHDGYKPFEVTARVDTHETTTIQADLIQLGGLRILSAPTEADVLINGVSAGKTPVVTELDVGETVIRIEKAGYEAWEGTVSVEGGTMTTISRELSKDARAGSVHFRGCGCAGEIARGADGVLVPLVVLLVLRRRRR